MNREITALNVPGNVREMDSIETESNYIHQYNTVKCLNPSIEDILRQLEDINGVITAKTDKISENHQYTVEISVDSEETLRNDTYQEVLKETTAWIP